MRLSVFSALALLPALSAASMFDVPANRRPDVNAFVNRKVYNTSDLLHQVKTDPQVAARYERHFSMTKDEVLNYFSSLHRSRLQHSGTYTIYSIPDDGHVKMHRGILRKGEPLFFDRKGEPILVVKCGNPLVLGKQQATLFRPLTPQPSELETERDLPLTRDPEFLDTAEMTSAIPDLPLALATPGAVPAAGALALTTVPASLIGGGGFPFLALAPLVVPVIRGGGGGGFIPNNTPEPMTLAPLAVGAVCLLRRRRK